MNCDLLINKIMYYLSQLPFQLSFEMMKPKLYQLCEYIRFNDYISSWPQQTGQMETTRVLYTEMQPGPNYIQEKCSYLKKKFFNDHPTEKPETVLE